MGTQWVWQSMSAMFLLIPIWLCVQYFDKNHGVSSDVFLAWYFFGTAITVSILAKGSITSLFPSLGLTAILLAIGLTVGGLANILLFRSVASAPNAGLPLAIANTATVGVYLASIKLVDWFPGKFIPVKVDRWSIAGIALTIIGTTIVAIRK
jgi:hypothetical protein